MAGRRAARLEHDAFAAETGPRLVEWEIGDWLQSRSTRQAQTWPPRRAAPLVDEDLLDREWAQWMLENSKWFSNFKNVPLEDLVRMVRSWRLKGAEAIKGNRKEPGSRCRPRLTCGGCLPWEASGGTSCEKAPWRPRGLLPTWYLV
jgi:hypothetical protein